MLTLTIGIIAIALVFDYINGFHDAANSVATVVATRVLSPFQAVLWAATFNFAAVFSFGTGVAHTVGAGMVDLKAVTPYVILSGLMGAIVWDLATWWWGLPTSSSHALFGGYAGAAMAHVAYLKGLSQAASVILWHGWINTLAFMVISPVFGLLLAHVLMVALYWLFRKSTPKQMDTRFRKLQLLSAAVYSYSHGTNDAQKTMGIITSVLVAGGFLSEFHVPAWVMLSACGAMALGTLSGGWRIVRTMGSRLTRLRPRSGFCAEAAAATSILLATHFHVGVSTTHVIVGAIAGVGSIQRVKAVRWGVAASIVWAWLLTIPMSAAVAALFFSVLRLFVPAA
ncbi:MAG: inorganic phosphate transporter [Bryobacterales bacterium]|nr:inorganic phosphate transporter [Bryobacterales bacterium]